MHDTIRILVIAPGTAPKPRDIPNTLEAKQTIVKGCIEAIGLPGGAVLYCNEEGKTKRLTPNRTLRSHDGRTIIDIIAGTFLIAGTDPGTGEDASLTAEQQRRWTREFHEPEVAYRTPSGRTGMRPARPSAANDSQTGAENPPQQAAAHDRRERDTDRPIWRDWTPQQQDHMLADIGQKAANLVASIAWHQWNMIDGPEPAADSRELCLQRLEDLRGLMNRDARGY